MTPGTKALIAQAASNLSLENLVLHECRFSRPGDLPNGGLGYGPQYKRVVGYSVQGEGEDRRLVVKVDLGVRLAKFPAEEAEKGSEPPVAVVIEADFLVIFRMNRISVRSVSKHLRISTLCIMRGLSGVIMYSILFSAGIFLKSRYHYSRHKLSLPQRMIKMAKHCSWSSSEG